MSDSDPLAPFIEAKCTVGPEFFETAAALYRAYKAWAESQGFREKDILSVTAFGRRMGERFTPGHNRGGNFYGGIKIHV